MLRGNTIKSNYVGMIPHSLELIKLKQQEFTVFSSKKHPNKQLSNDVINVKFNQKVRGALEIIKECKKNLSELENKKLDDKQKEYKMYLEQRILEFEKVKNRKGYQEVKIDDLRSHLYQNGFTVATIDKDTGEISKTVYVVYKRSSAKSRTGQCLFIKEDLYNVMINWSRLSLPLVEDMSIDYASLLAYESLVGSSIEDTIKINPEKILIVDDVDSKFNQTANVVEKGQDGYLDSVTKDVKISNSLFDGQSLLDAKYFKKGQSMKLLRNHMFKSAAFNTNIQTFLKDNCPDDIDYEDWLLKDMFGNMVYAKDVELIITPSSLKALKFSSVIGEDKYMWDYWKQKVKEDGNLFGVCKHEKASKKGYDYNDNILQQTSYQMINSMPLQKEDLEKLTVFERQYIDDLKNNDDIFINHIEKHANTVNSNLMFVELYSINPDIVHTKVFRDFRKQQIKDHINHIKKGKVRLNGDYCVMLGNAVEFLLHAIGKFDLKETKLTLKENEVYTTLFDDGKELTGFRNPHTSPSNVLICKNTYNGQIKEYFNLSENIVVVNAVKFALQDILSGSDYDSDTILLIENEDLLSVSKKCYGQYYVCINKVDGNKKNYNLNKTHMCEIDNQLSNSQRNIGEVVNLGQLCMSRYWDLINGGSSVEGIKQLLKITDVMTVLSGICIDMAKKFYDINIEDEIKNVKSHLQLKTVVVKGKEIEKKPKFWVNVSQNSNVKKSVANYECPMDYLDVVMSDLSKADYKKNINLIELLIKQRTNDANRKQKSKIEMYIRELKVVATSLENEQLVDKNEKYNMLEDATNVCANNIAKFKVKKETMYDILSRIEDDYSEIALRTMNILHKTQPEMFINAFKKSQNFSKQGLDLPINA